jgi:hypothetical protein
MSLENELRQLFGRAEDAPWPGEFDAFDRFLDRRRRRGRALAAAAALALVVVAAVGVLVPRLLPKQLPAVAPPGAVIRVVDSGFELRAPAGWKLGRMVTDTTEAFPGQTRKSVRGVELIPQSGTLNATITTMTDQRGMSWTGASQRSDGRLFVLGASDGQRGFAEYAIDWPNYCSPYPVEACTPSGRRRQLLVVGSAPGADPRTRETVLEAMRQIAVNVQPITNALRPPPCPPSRPAPRCCSARAAAAARPGRPGSSRLTATAAQASASISRGPRHTYQVGLFIGRAWSPNICNETAVPPTWGAWIGFPGLAGFSWASPAKTSPTCRSS